MWANELFVFGNQQYWLWFKHDLLFTLLIIALFKLQETSYSDQDYRRWAHLFVGFNKTAISQCVTCVALPFAKYISRENELISLYDLITHTYTHTVRSEGILSSTHIFSHIKHLYLLLYFYLLKHIMYLYDLNSTPWYNSQRYCIWHLDMEFN